MSLLSVFETLSNSLPVAYLRDSKYGMPGLQSMHLTGLTVLLATVLVQDLRLAGLGMKEYELAWLARQLKPWTLGALTVVMASGFLIFLGTPEKYLASAPFRLKMALLCLAILFHFAVLRRFTAAASPTRPRTVNVIVAFLSLTFWFGVGWAGRAIAFVP